ncbi:sigma-70 family RNA polymerase sigma factor [Haloactinopolyspora sp.]|uniref:sigma-70 family RNA polymerase sigma factor n=1 Tax=Haloactinopolyspora sp. TaxID=1966353 RepID=UPI00261FE21D|nr:sigma-70 family RNA polymerase sigma factor [Haloactinopolyspora sp.]
MDPESVELFEVNRDRLGALAYRLLGSAADAEDVVQDAFLRWQAADLDRIAAPAAWLTTVVTNLSLDRLRSAQARRERTIGAWLPDPLLDGDPMLGPADTVEQRESVTLAVLTLMERLRPVERAVYVLREAFSHSHAEIAAILGITESASQQHAHRARDRLRAERSFRDVDQASARRIVEAFVEAAASGRTARLLSLLTDDATAIIDGAGLAEAPLRYSGAERIAAVARAGFKLTPLKRRLAGGAPSIYAGTVNGSPAMIAAFPDRIVSVVVLDLHDGRIASVRGLAAPNRLSRLNAQWQRREHDDLLIESWPVARP